MCVDLSRAARGMISMAKAYHELLAERNAYNGRRGCLMPLFPLLLNSDEIAVLLAALYRVERPDATIHDSRERLTWMQVDAELEPSRRAIEEWLEQMQDRMDALRRRLSP
jgi:hypothetical protein